MLFRYLVTKDLVKRLISIKAQILLELRDRAKHSSVLKSPRNFNDYNAIYANLLNNRLSF